MSYVIKRCKVCGKVYHLHSNKKITGAYGDVPCEHVIVKKSRRMVKAVPVDVAELEEIMRDNGGD